MDAIPGPRGRWLVGELPEYEKDKVGWLTRSRETYGDVVRLAPHVVVVHDAEAAYEVLAGTNRDFLLDDAMRADQLGDLADRLPHWMRRRRWVTRAVGRHLTPVHAERMAGMLAEELDACAGRTDDLVRLCRTVCARADVRFVLCPDEELIEAARVAFDDWLAVIEAGEPRVRWLPRPAARRSARSGRRLRELVTEHVARRGSGDGLLDEICAEVSDPAEQVDAAFTLLFSAQGLPGVTMSWLLLELAAHPEHAAELRAELTGASVADAAALPLTGAFVHEVLRLHPPQWLVSRVSSQPAELAGHTVPAGQQVLISPYLIHRDKRHWDDPETFDPSRWLSGRRPAKAFMPFGAGPRYCPGSSLAMAQLVALVALFVTSYSFTLETAGTPDHRGLLMPAGARGSWHPRDMAIIRHK